MSDKSGLKIDGDAIWINREKGFTFDKDALDADRGEGEELIVNLEDEKKLLGEIEEGMQLFEGGHTVQADDLTNDSGRKTPGIANVTGDLPSDACDRDQGQDDDFEDLKDKTQLDAEFDETKLGETFKPSRESEDGSLVYANSDSDMGSLASDDAIDEDQDDPGSIEDDDEHELRK